MVDIIRTTTILEYDPACHQIIHLAILSPPVPRATSTSCLLHHWRHRACLVYRYTDYRHLSVLANTLLLAASWPGPLHPDDQLLHHTCLSEPSYRCRRFDSAHSIHLADTNPKEQETFALCSVPAWFNVRYAIQCVQDANQKAPTNLVPSVCVTSVVRLQTLTDIDAEDITCRYPSLRWI